MKMTITEKTRIRMACGTKVYAVKGTNLNEKDLEDFFYYDAPFGFFCRINAEKTEATCTCYYD